MPPNGLGVAGASGPFQPGDGGLPPHLAGREEEQALFRRRLDDLERGVAPPAEIALCGPRGNGKTALLFWLENLVGEREALEVVGLSPATAEDRGGFAEAIRSRSWWRQLLPEKISPLRPATWSAKERGRSSLETVLRKRVSKRPLVLLLDEAHTLERESGRLLLNASQQVGRRFPFLLVLAGTPDLPARLNALGASFWNRCERRRIGRLDDGAAAAALSEPLRAEGFPIVPEALERLVRESHGYPYFLQVLGDEVWKRIVARPPSAGRSVSRSEVEAVLPSFRETQRLYYLDRYDELGSRDLLPAARAVAAAFAKGRAELGDDDLREAVARGLGKQPGAAKTAAAERELRHLGFVWRAGVERVWEPGIPSLLDYVLEHAPKRCSPAQFPARSRARRAFPGRTTNRPRSLFRRGRYADSSFVPPVRST